MVLKARHKAQHFLLLLCCALGLPLEAQQVWQYESDAAHMVFFDRTIAPHIPHMARMQQLGIALHGQVWDSASVPGYRLDRPLLYYTDWSDDGNGGVCAFPRTTIQIGMAPLNMSFYVAPSVERYYHLFTHEQTHVVMTDKASSADMRWRRLFGSKVVADNRQPLSALWSYATTPRWYAPRWYHEGIACFLETWMDGGVGRALGGYDEMYFRSLVLDSSRFSSVVGLESEGSTTDFQLGTNAYLYGTRFVNYLQLRHGFDTLARLYNRTDSSRRFFARQFRETYGQDLREAWDEWQRFERTHQEHNLALVRSHPLTPVRCITRQPLGSVAAPLYDPRSRRIFTAVNHPGDFARTVSIGLDDGHVRNLHNIDGPRLYITAYMAYDSARNQLIVTTQNQDFRGLAVLDADNGRLLQRVPLQRVGDIVWCDATRQLYGIYISGGVASIIRYDSTLLHRELLYAFPFGTEVFDLSCSHDGRRLCLTASDDNGGHRLLLFEVADLEQAAYRYRVVKELADANLSGFRFSLDDQHLIGSSYYTGVSNLWRVSVATGEMELLSNSERGLFAPLQIAPDTLLALQFERDGLRPVTLPLQPIADAEAIEYLGQLAFDRDPRRLDSLNMLRQPLPPISFGEVYDSIRPYRPLHEMRFSGAYPAVTGFVDREAFNSVTPVLGYRVHFQDPVGLSQVQSFVGISPWSHNPLANQLHADISFRCRLWHASASWNHSDFYDLFGPAQTSRKGYSIAFGYSRTNRIMTPLKREWGADLAAYGLMDALPVAQNVLIGPECRSLQALSAYWHLSKTRTSLGGTSAEQGWELGTDNQLGLAAGHLYPLITATANGGVLLPVMRNTSLWLRNTAGTTLGSREDPFAYSYFGGFQNNWVDCSTPYRAGGIWNYGAMPGAEISQLRARSFLRSQLTLSLQPVRFNDFGFLFLYPTCSQLKLFAGSLLATEQTFGNSRGSWNHYADFGAELSTEVMLFNYMRTTWSIGFARIFGSDGSAPALPRNEWMVSLKLL